MRYAIFPTKEIKENANVVLYGAGAVAKNYCKQNRVLEHCNILFAVDSKVKDDEKKYVSGICVYSVNTLLQMNYSEYDYVLISVLDKDSRNRIEEMLISNNIPREKIINIDNNIFDWEMEYENKSEELEVAGNVDGYLQLIQAEELFSCFRLDIAVRYLVFKDWYRGIYNSVNESMYRRFILSRTGAYECINHNSGYSKSGIEEYITKAKEMCSSIWNDGFKKEGFVPLGKDGKPKDGLHRIAAAIVGKQNVWAHDYGESIELCERVDFSWFVDNDFSTEDCVRILRAYCDIYNKNVGIYVLYGNCINDWEFIEGYISKELHIVGSVEYNFEQDYLTFKNIVSVLYDSYSELDEGTIISNPLKMKVVVVSDEEYKGQNFYGTMAELGEKITEFIGIPLMMSYSENERKYHEMKNMLLSVNGLKNLSSRIVKDYSKEFVDKIEKLKGWCDVQKISINDVCVIGDAVLEALGIRQSDEIKIAISSKVDMKKVTEIDEFKIVDAKFMLEEKNLAVDDILCDDNFYFVVNGVKFENLEFVYKRKANSSSYIDIRDCRHIQLFNDCQRSFGDKNVLRKQLTKKLKER